MIGAKAIPHVYANPKAIERINESEYIIAGPGDLYSSVISVALADGIAEAYSHSHGKLIYIMNLMTKASQTQGYGAYQHLLDFSQYYHRMPDVCIINTKKIAHDMLTKYKEVGEETVIDDLAQKGYKGKIITADLVDANEHKDTHSHLSASYAHSIVRHDETRLKEVLERVIKTI